METAMATALPSVPRSRWTVVAVYVAVLVAAEALIAIKDPASPLVYPYQSWGLTLHLLLVFGLVYYAVFVENRDAALAALLVALTLASLDRIFSLSVPRYPSADPRFTLVWLGYISAPLLVSVAAVAYVQRVKRRDLGLGLGTPKAMALQALVALTGVPLGVTEYAILKPPPWDTAVLWGGFASAVVVIFLATGLSEELIFRGIILQRATAALGNRPGLLFVTIVFTSLHLFYNNAADLAFVFGVGLLYAFVAFRTRNLWGVIVSHTLANVILYLIAPGLFSSLP